MILYDTYQVYDNLYIIMIYDNYCRTRVIFHRIRIFKTTNRCTLSKEDTRNPNRSSRWSSWIPTRKYCHYKYIHCFIGQISILVRSIHILVGQIHMSMDWFKGKSTGNHRFSHEDHVAFRLKFSLKPIHWPKGSKIRYPNNWMVNTKLDIHICGPLVLGLPFWLTSILPSRNLSEKNKLGPWKLGLSCKFSLKPIHWYPSYPYDIPMISLWYPHP